MSNQSQDNGIYEGEIIDNLKEGKGTLLYANGDKYEGEWKHNLKEGKGILLYNNGEK